MTHTQATNETGDETMDATVRTAVTAKIAAIEADPIAWAQFD